MDTHDIGRGFRARTAKLGLCVPAVALLAGSASAQDRTARTIATAARTQNQVAERRIGKAFDLPPDLPAAFDRMAQGTSARTFATFSAPSA